MPEHIRVLNKFEWLPPEKRPSRFPGPKPPRKPETRKPLFFVARDGDDLYFVNNSNETLNRVSTSTGGCQTLDDGDDVIAVRSVEPLYLYENVKPGEAVKVEHYDPYWDCDFLLQIEVNVSSPSHGNKLFRVLGKGGVVSTVLLWDNGEKGKYVHMEPV
jgi:hypothetical protein